MDILTLATDHRRSEKFEFLPQLFRGGTNRRVVDAFEDPNLRRNGADVRDPGRKEGRNHVPS